MIDRSEGAGKLERSWTQAPQRQFLSSLFAPGLRSRTIAKSNLARYRRGSMRDPHVPRYGSSPAGSGPLAGLIHESRARRATPNPFLHMHPPDLMNMHLFPTPLSNDLQKTVFEASCEIRSFSLGRSPTIRFHHGMSPPTFAEIMESGPLSIFFQCHGCCETWTVPVARFNPDLTVKQFETLHFCPFCRWDNPAFNWIFSPAYGQPGSIQGPR